MWTIEPGKSVGPLALSMSEDQYVSILGSVADTFHRTPDSMDIVVAYDDAGVHLGVDQGRCIRRISVFAPRKVALSGVQLLGRPLTDVAHDLSRTVFEFNPVDAGLWCCSANIVLVAVDGLVDGVEIGPVSEPELPGKRRPMAKE